MSEVSMIGLDIAKNVFQAHGADAKGKKLFSQRLSRAKLLPFFAKLPPCVVGIEACGGSHHWARQLAAMGHQVRLLPAAAVKPFVKRHKSDVIDAAAICEAMQRPDIHFVPVKSEAQQAAAMTFRLRDMLVRQRTQMINALRGHLAEFGWIAPQGTGHVAKLGAVLDSPEAASLPADARDVLKKMVEMIAASDSQIAELDKQINQRSREDPVARRLMTIPGIGPIAANAITALAPALENFPRARDFAAWLGLTPLQKSTGGKRKLGHTSKMGERTIRRLLIIGASAVIANAVRRESKPDTWLGKLLARKPRMLAIVALANKIARIVWAVITKQQNYRALAAAA